ncbi:MAG: nitroreductase family protein [Thermodesulfobacteriota bacterium]
MALFRIDPQKCNQDGICAQVCPVKIIEPPTGIQVPSPVEEAGKHCIQCGHCVAACPTAAFSHSKMDPEDCPPIREDWQLSPEQTEHFLRSRRSIRNYQQKAVEREKLEKAVHIASYAPSGHNRQPVKWQVIYNKEDVQRISEIVLQWMRYLLQEQPDFARNLHMDRVVEGWEAGLDPITRDAPHLILNHAEKSDPTAQAACTIALSYLELAAPSLGLGACWAGFVNAAALFWPPMQEELDLPQDDVLYGAMLMGYPKFKYKRLPLRNKPNINWR